MTSPTVLSEEELFAGITGPHPQAVENIRQALRAEREKVAELEMFKAQIEQQGWYCCETADEGNCKLASGLRGRAESAEKENADLKAMVGELIQELRDREMGTSFKGRDLEIEDRRHCGICRKNWPVAEPEQHAPDCLLVTMPARLAEIDGAPKAG